MKKIIIIVLACSIAKFVFSQEFIPIWEGVEMPNSKGIPVKDSIANERIHQVGIPGVYIFTPSKEENKNCAILIIPGGGYARLTYNLSGFQLAKWANTLGMTAFVLNHRLPHSPDLIERHKAPLQDAQRAMKFIRANAGKWNIELNKIGVMGCSAGGHLAACLSTISENWSEIGDELDKYDSHPDFTLLVSPVISMGEYAHGGSLSNLLGNNPTKDIIEGFSCEKQVSHNTPPAFLVHAFDDEVVSPMNGILYYTALKKNNIKKSTIHIFPEGGHNIALTKNPGITASWILLAEGWLEEIGITR